MIERMNMKNNIFDLIKNANSTVIEKKSTIFSDFKLSGTTINIWKQSV